MPDFSKIASLAVQQQEQISDSGFGSYQARPLEVSVVGTLIGTTEDNTAVINTNTTAIIPAVDANTSATVSASTTAINSNTDTKTSAVTTNVNSNTNTKVDTLKPTPGVVKGTFTSGTTYQTIFNYSGQGELIYIWAAAGITNSGQSAGFKITVDGSVYAVGTITGVVSSQYAQIFNDLNYTDTPYLLGWGTSASSSLYVNPIPFKTSLKLEIFSDAGTVRQYKFYYKTNV